MLNNHHQQRAKALKYLFQHKSSQNQSKTLHQKCAKILFFLFPFSFISFLNRLLMCLRNVLRKRINKFNALEQVFVINQISINIWRSLSLLRVYFNSIVSCSSQANRRLKRKMYHEICSLSKRADIYRHFVRKNIFDT